MLPGKLPFYQRRRYMPDQAAPGDTSGTDLGADNWFALSQHHPHSAARKQGSAGQPARTTTDH